MTGIPTNISFLSRRSYSERLQRLISLIDKHPAELRKEYLKEFLTDLCNEEHYIYALLENLPLEEFSIARVHEHTTAKNNIELKDIPDVYSIKGFFTCYDQFNDKDFFRVSFVADHFYFKLELTPMLFISFYERFLAYHCEKGLRTNKPVILTPQLCKQYGLTFYDAQTVRYYLKLFNKEITERIQFEYEALKLLDCIKK